MKVWITKYALSTGIIEVDAEISGTMVSYKPDDKSFNTHAHGNEWWEYKSDALLRAEEMRVKKLQSLDKQIKKVSALIFE